MSRCSRLLSGKVVPLARTARSLIWPRARTPAVRLVSCSSLLWTTARHLPRLLGGSRLLSSRLVKLSTSMTGAPNLREKPPTKLPCRTLALFSLLVVPPKSRLNLITLWDAQLRLVGLICMVKLLPVNPPTVLTPCRNGRTKITCTTIITSIVTRT